MFHDEVGTNSAVTDNSVSENKEKGGEKDKAILNIVTYGLLEALQEISKGPAFRERLRSPIAY